MDIGSFLFVEIKFHGEDMQALYVVRITQQSTSRIATPGVIKWHMSLFTLFYNSHYSFQKYKVCTFAFLLHLVFIPETYLGGHCSFPTDFQKSRHIPLLSPNKKKKRQMFLQLSCQWIPHTLHNKYQENHCMHRSLTLNESQDGQETI